MMLALLWRSLVNCHDLTDIGSRASGSAPSYPRINQEEKQMNGTGWVIRETKTNKDKVALQNYWSVDLGWTTLDYASRYSKQDRLTLDLPVDGEWVSLTRLTSFSGGTE
jgi:hypothetical protein